LNALNYYVYYRIDPVRVAEMRSIVAVLFDEVTVATRVQGRLQRRRDDPSTWMEIYENVPESATFESALEAALVKAGFARLDAQRKTEVFQCA